MQPETKKDFQDLLFKVLNPIRSKYSKGNALIKLGSTGTKYDERCAQMEGFSRSFWGLVPYFAGGGDDDDFLKKCIEGLENGTNPEHEEYWGGFGEIDQRFCEMAAFALGLLLIPEKIWDPLPRKAKDNIVEWLLNINAYKIGPNNWQFFLVLVNTSLKKLGERYDQEAMDFSLERIDSFYLGNGWYQDGRLPNKDYYVPFAFHFYGLIYAQVMEEEDPVRSNVFRERAKQFAQDYVYWFDEKAEAVPYGRSLTYRFAQVSFFSACLFAGIEPIPMPVMKGLISKHLDLWLHEEIYDNGDIITIGYKYPNMLMAENYNGPGSPLWALKAFLFLALPDDHPFWETKAEPLPNLESIKVMPEAEKIFIRESDSVTMYPAGTRVVAKIQGHMGEKYCKFAYSSKYGFSVHSNTDILDSLAPDSTLVFEVEGRLYPRLHYIKLRIEEDKIVTNWSPTEGIEVETTIIPSVGGHIRKHAVKSDVDCVAYDCGFALPRGDEEYEEFVTNSSALVKHANGFCKVDGGQEAFIIKAQPNTNVMTQRTSIPTVKHIVNIGESLLETSISFE